MNKRFHVSAAALAVALLLAACGGGGGGGTGGSTNSGNGGGTGGGGTGGGTGGGGGTTVGLAQGVYQGVTSNSKTHKTIVLDDDRYYTVYGAETNGKFVVVGFLTGNGTAADGKFTSTNLKDFYANGTVVSGSMNASFVPKVSFTGTTSDGTNTVTFTGSTVTGTSYSYAVPATPANIAGTWTMSTLQGATVALDVAANGSFSATTDGCSLTGTMTPRASGKNVFDVSMTYGAAPCALAGQSATGVAIEYTYTNAAKQELIIVGTNDARDKGSAFFGTRDTADALLALSTTDIVVGTGAEAVAGTTATITYTGWLYSYTTPDHKGTQFASDSFSFTLGANQVIPGLEQGVQGMRIGGKRMIYVPASMAYGTTGYGPIPPNSALVYQVELTNVQ
jgi:FKBP-type peptidyl-prolyl cis-trans isomerase 2